METRANYAVVGFFTILVIAAAFGFVYWMSNYGRQGDMAPMDVRIPGSANGLSVGSPVRFNGIQVGSVKGLTIDDDDPTYVVARTEVRTDAPVYPSTKANLEVQGLTGSAYIELSGGEKAGENLLQKAERTGDVATIRANPSSVANILSTANRILTKVNATVGELQTFSTQVRGPLTKTIQNTETFSQALADNSKGIDQFLQSVGSLSDTVKNLSGRLDSTLASVQTLVEAVDAKKIDDIVTNADHTTRQIAEASDQLNETMGEIQKTAATYRAVGEKAEKALDSVDTLLASVDPEQVGGAIDNVAAASQSARTALKQVQQVAEQFSKHDQDIDQTIDNITAMSKKLNAASSRVDSVLAKVDGFLGQSGSTSIMSDAKSTLDSFKQVADTLNKRIGPIADNLQQFSGNGLKGVEQLIDQLSHAVNQIQGAVSSIEENPQQLIFGGKNVKEYNGGRTRR
ncbi:MlaD family protein [Pararhizobium mangrovi]|uniref:MCE family protein n=1 Tax=Pararhizobium mangrovi TaxID=2590452 RepID=A0A506U7J5_9HYPH|nr:MlaD family protein [Pararhizobium mangrovi]TPW29316.1 MCE family protein [Pararhizobium mangrovi]